MLSHFKSNLPLHEGRNYLNKPMIIHINNMIILADQLNIYPAADPTLDFVTIDFNIKNDWIGSVCFDPTKKVCNITRESSRDIGITFEEVGSI